MKNKKTLSISLIVCIFLIGICVFEVSGGSVPVYNTALVFNGTDTYVKLEQPYANVPNTFEAWVKVPKDFPDDTRVGVIIGSYDANNREGSFNVSFGIHKTGSPRIYWNNGEVDVIVTEYDFRTGDWVHLAVVRDETVRRGVFTFYMNGEQIFQYFFGAGTTVIPRDPAFIGGDYRALTSPGVPIFNGAIGEIRVWHTARTADQIKDNMNVELTGDEPGLLGYWKFDEGEGEILHDSSPYKNHGIIVNPNWSKQQ